MKPQCQTILDALKRGEKLTMLTALQRYSIFACSQRVSELCAMGYPIKSRLIETENGKRVSEYSLD